MKSFPFHIKTFLYLSIFLFILFLIYSLYFHSNSFSIDTLPSPSQIPIYFINLKDSQERFHKINSQCTSLHLSCHRIDAVQGKTLDRSQYSHLIKSPKMKDTTIACFLSHMKALETFLQTDQQIALILEDDVDISHDFVPKMNQIYNELKEKQTDFDLLFLGGTRICGEKFSPSLLKAKHIHHNCNAGAFAYIVSRRGANQILKEIRWNGITKMYDHQIRDSFSQMKVFYANPPLVTHDFEIPSDRLDGTYTPKYIHQSQEILIK